MRGAIVHAAAQLEIRGIRGAAIGERDDVMEFEEPALGTTPLRADDRAAACNEGETADGPGTKFTKFTKFTKSHIWIFLVSFVIFVVFVAAAVGRRSRL